MLRMMVLCFIGLLVNFRPSLSAGISPGFMSDFETGFEGANELRF